ncbi:MAG: hypothetical protein LQ347_005920 [Umbilicaria vellea]|nr:MAG: hypothetical protein LQ347_005920 [Umbilicaria vellea]
MASISDEDMATLQKLSNDYEPEVEGPLVGHRQSSHAITTQYAQADPVYVRKTAVRILCASYSPLIHNNMPLTSSSTGSTPYLFALPDRAGRWQLRMAR